MHYTGGRGGNLPFLTFIAHGAAVERQGLPNLPLKKKKKKSILMKVAVWVVRQNSERL